MELFIMFVLLQVADAWTTKEVLARGGRELNPLIRWLILKAGVAPALVVPKAAVCVPVWWYLVPPKAEWYYLAVFVLFYAVVVGNNLLVLRRMRGD